jgi:hypothetical protein
MKIKSFGCSFIFGSDLADAGTGFYNPPPSQKTWPALIAKHYNYDYECLARPGCGNLHIMESILNQTQDPEPCVYIICWTWIDRFDHWTDRQNWVHHKFSKNNWQTIRPGDESDLADFYYRNLHHSYNDKLNSLLHINLTIDILKENKIPFLMTYTDNLIFETQFHNSHAVELLQSRMAPYMHRFEGHTFLEWSKQQGFDISERLHPLEQAHEAAADVMLQVFDKQKIIFPVPQAHA